MAATSEMLDIALREKPHAPLYCSRKARRAHDGKVDLDGSVRSQPAFAPLAQDQLSEAGIRGLAVFIEADENPIGTPAY